MTAKYTRKVAAKMGVKHQKKKSSIVQALKRNIMKLNKHDRFEVLKSFRADITAITKSIGGTIEDKSLKYLTPQDVADALGVSKPYIHKLIKDGKLEASTFGNRMRITPSDFKKFEKEFTKKISVVAKSVKKSVEDFGDAYFDDLPESMK